MYLPISIFILGNSECSCTHTFEKGCLMMQPVWRLKHSQHLRRLNDSDVHVVELLFQLTLQSRCAWIAESNVACVFVINNKVCVVNNVQIMSGTFLIDLVVFVLKFMLLLNCVFTYVSYYSVLPYIIANAETVLYTAEYSDDVIEIQQAHTLVFICY
jgi:hypothetical protein